MESLFDLGGKEGDEGNNGGMKRLRELEELSDLELSNLPDEVLALIILSVFDWRIDTREELTELMNLREVSHRFRDIVDSLVFPQIRFINHALADTLAKTNVDTLLRFSGLQSISVNSFMYSTELIVVLFALLAPSLVKVQLSQWMTPGMQNIPVKPLSALKKLRELALFDLTVDPGEFAVVLSNLPQLEALGLVRVQGATITSVATVSTLQRLSLMGDVGSDLTPLHSLSRLHTLNIETAAHGTERTMQLLQTLGEVTSLTKFSLQRGSRSFARPTYGEMVELGNSLGQLVQLRALSLSGMLLPQDGELELALGQLSTTLRSLLLPESIQQPPYRFSSIIWLARLPMLESLCMDHLKIPADAYYEDFHVKMKRHWPSDSLRWLSLRSTILPPYMLYNFNQLTYLDVSNSYGDESLDEVDYDDPVSEMTQLHTLHMSAPRCPVSPYVLENLGASLRNLNVSTNDTVTDLEIAHLTVLERLDVSDDFDTQNTKIVGLGIVLMRNTLTHLYARLRHSLSFRNLVRLLPRLRFLEAGGSSLQEPYDTMMRDGRLYNVGDNEVVIGMQNGWVDYNDATLSMTRQRMPQGPYETLDEWKEVIYDHKNY